jgi:hypothetical protein
MRALYGKIRKEKRRDLLRLFYYQALAAFGAAALEHGAAIFALHALAEAMHAYTATLFWLIGSLGHRNELLLDGAESSAI